MKARLILLFLTGLVGACAEAGPPDCRAVEHAEQAFTVCSFPADADIRLQLTHSDGDLFAQFERVSEQAASEGKTLIFAMNAGMYHQDRTPVGLFVENGDEYAPIVTQAGAGNFGMLPNGVFVVTKDGAQVLETNMYIAAELPIHSATQSGPMLVINGKLHPKFNPEGTSRKRRNGIGVSADGDTIHFAISDGFVTFHEFGTLFRDVLKTPNALYLDGTVSRIYAPGIDRNEAGLDMGPIVSIVR